MQRKTPMVLRPEDRPAQPMVWGVAGACAFVALLVFATNLIAQPEQMRIEREATAVPSLASTSGLRIQPTTESPADQPERAVDIAPLPIEQQDVPAPYSSALAPAPAPIEEVQARAAVACQPPPAPLGTPECMEERAKPFWTEEELIAFTATAEAWYDPGTLATPAPAFTEYATDACARAETRSILCP